MRSKNRFDTNFITRAGLIAAMYVALTFVAQIFGLASGAIQFRLSEALTILPMFTSAAIPGLAVGCILANVLTGCAMWDVVFGSLATLLGAVGTYYLRKTENPLLGCPHSPHEGLRGGGRVSVPGAHRGHRRGGLLRRAGSTPLQTIKEIQKV